MPQAPLLCNQKPRVAVGTRKERAGRERERLDRARTSIKSIRKLQAAASACPLLPVPPENTSSHRDTHLTGGHGGSCQVNTNLFLLSHTRQDVANVTSSGQMWTLQMSSSNSSLEENQRNVNWLSLQQNLQEALSSVFKSIKPLRSMPLWSGTTLIFHHHFRKFRNILWFPHRLI